MLNLLRKFLKSGGSVKIAKNQSVVGDTFYNSPITIGETPEKIRSILESGKEKSKIDELRREVVQYNVYIDNFDEENEFIGYMAEGQSINGISLKLIKIYDELAIRQLSLGAAILHKTQKTDSINKNSIHDYEEAREHLESAVKMWSIASDPPFGSWGYQSDLNLGIVHSYLGWSLFGIGIIKNDLGLLERSIGEHAKATKLVKSNHYMEWKEINIRYASSLASLGSKKKDIAYISKANEIYMKCLIKARSYSDREAQKIITDLMNK